MKEFIEGPHPLNANLWKIVGIQNPVILADPGKRKANGFLELKGKRFGRQVCLEWIGSEIAEANKGKKKALWLVLCDCGDRRVSRSARIVRSESCGCIGIEKTKIFNTKTKTKVSYISFSGLWQAYRSSAKKRGYSFDLTKEQFMEITTKNCHYCDSAPSMARKPRTKGKIPAYLHNGIDRVDNSLGYSIENVVPCCKFCNRAKGSFSQEEFIENIRKIYLYYVR